MGYQADLWRRVRHGRGSFLAFFPPLWRVKVLTVLVTGIRRGQEKILVMYTGSSIQEVEQALFLTFFSLPCVASNLSLLEHAYLVLSSPPSIFLT